ncbi:MAG TPA: M23 family metallopeptidase [Candidatus Binatia bacterium]|nr:M23 family metallopeptidase [Candidatus Binatia bacterium]
MKLRLVCLLIFSALLPAAQEKAKKYVWPLFIANGISSTFQEFRSNHFHAGIDLRTFQTTGFPVRAVADGTVEKITVSNAGIGLAVFLRHHDGMLSIYGHLENFSGEIDALAVREQKRRGRKYFGELVPPVQLAVSQGQVIAFSGESGSGFPHLHFEIRDQANGSLNPLSLIAAPTTDRQGPVLKGILLRSRGNGLLNDDLGEIYCHLRGAGALYRLPEPLKASGPFDLALNVIDLSAESHVVAPYSMEAYLDGELYYQITFDRLVRDDNNQLGMLYDMSYSTASNYFYKLFTQNGFVLETRRIPFERIFGTLPPGLHEIKIIVKDRQLNQSVALLPILKTPPAEPGALRKELDLKANEGRVLLDDHLSFYIHRDEVVVKLPGFTRPTGWITLKVIQGGQERMIQAQEYGSGVFFYFKPLNDDMNVTLHFILSDGRQPVEMLQKNIQLLVLKSQTARQFHAADFHLDFAAKTVLETTVLLLEPKRLEAEYPLLAGPVSVTPTHFTFLDSVFFKFRVPDGQALPEQLGIFKYHPRSKRWLYIKTQRTPEPGFLGARVLNGGIFALLRDIYPPEIHFRSRRTRYLESCKKIVFNLRDRGKGIDEQSVAVFLNGKHVESEYDPDWGHVQVGDTDGLRRGSNDLRVRVADLAGNRSEKKFIFRLK